MKFSIRRKQKPPAANEAFTPEEIQSAVAVVKDKKYAVGLTWRTIPDGSTAKAVTQEVAKDRASPSFYVLLRKAKQVGYAWKADGHKRGMPSLAAAFALAHQPTIASAGDGDLGVFEVAQDVYYVIGSVSGIIMADTDLLIYGKETAFSEFQKIYMRSPQWRNVYAPREFGFEEAREVSLDEVIIDRRKTPTLTEFFPLTLLIRSGLAVAAIAILAAGYHFWTKHERLEAEQRAAARAAAIRAAAARIAAEARANAGPWKSQPYFTQSLLLCTKAIKALPKSVAGWQLSDVDCSHQILKATYNLKGIGTIAWLDAAFHRGDVTWNGKTATVQWKLRSLPKQTAVAHAIDLNYYNIWISTHLAEAFIPYGIVKGKAPRPGARPVNRGIQHLFFPNLSVIVAIPYDPRIVLPILGKVSTLVLNDLNYQPSSGMWKLKATYYGTPKTRSARPK